MESDLRDIVLGRLQTGASLAGLGLATVDGRVDLRGLSSEPPVQLKRTEAALVGGATYEIARTGRRMSLKGVDLVNLDLSGSTLPALVLTDCRIRNCRFDRADLTSSAFYGVSFEDTSFERSSMRDVALGGRDHGRPTTYTGVSFVRSTMLGCYPLHAEFTDCDFSNAELKGVEFHDARFTRCRFAGRLDEVRFSGARRYLGLFGHIETLIDVDFSRCEFRWVELAELNLDRVQLPSNERHIVVPQPRCVLRRLLEDIRAHANPDADMRGFASQVELALRRAGPAQAQAVFSIHDLGESEQGRRRAAAMIHRAVAACTPLGEQEAQ